MQTESYALTKAVASKMASFILLHHWTIYQHRILCGDQLIFDVIFLCTGYLGNDIILPWTKLGQLHILNISLPKFDDSNCAKVKDQYRPFMMWVYALCTVCYKLIITSCFSFDWEPLLSVRVHRCDFIFSS